jgi:hypothetical protein
LVNEDASIMGGAGQQWDDYRKDEELYNLNDMIKKSKFYRGGTKFGYLPMKMGPKPKNNPSTTFGTVRRFAPEPGSVSSKT